MLLIFYIFKTVIFEKEKSDELQRKTKFPSIIGDFLDKHKQIQKPLTLPF
jgi:hypothetical protein